MAKKQTFGDKTAAKKAAKNSVKVIVSERIFVNLKIQIAKWY